MYTEGDLAAAVAAGALDAEAADGLRAHVAARRQTSTVDEEQFRLVTGFNDVFVTIACLLLLSSFLFGAERFSRPLGSALMIVASWGLAEFFTRRRRMALPSIVLTLSYAFGVLGLVSRLVDGDAGAGVGAIVGCVVVPLAIWLHWKRFKVPVSVAIGVAFLAAAFILAAGLAWSPGGGATMAIPFAIGVLTFALAMRWDAADRRRETRRSDVAFLAAPAGRRR